MYLKSLILKGFKSFADKVVLNLEPGITAIVGPNGSGKSNISDAVLWVLGERSARNLRGQAMEDIIFSGSAARKAVSVAEVDLVLDNSDHTLPVEFDEVVITRRMYRSGESEYLVNGVVSRRLDVLDILHDTGLGTGTHSIISQGSLDSILQSKPEDRRALIEEAAGVLKHKQRKEKSARKLEAMDNHLLRVRDVAGEVKRQLGPLERKAKRAEAYKEARAELKEVRLALAVDDLRKLQVKWDSIIEAEKEAAGNVELKRNAVTEAERKIVDIQELMRQSSDGANELSRKQRRAANLVERLESAGLLLRERRRAALASRSDTETALESSLVERTALTDELTASIESLEETQSLLENARKASSEAATRKGALEEKLRTIRRDIQNAQQEVREAERSVESLRNRRSILQENLAEGLAQVKLAEARKTQVQQELDQAVMLEAEARKNNDEIQSKLTELEQRNAKAQETLSERFNAKEQAQQDHDAMRAQHATAVSQAEAIRAAIRTNAEEDPAFVWLMDNAPAATGKLEPLSSWLKVDGSLESLVESLLGEDLSALPVDSQSTAAQIAQSLIMNKREGDVSLIVGRASDRYDRNIEGATSLLSLLSYPASMEEAVVALLGDVYVVDTIQEALRALDSNKGLRFISRDGCALWPNGRIRIYGPRAADQEGMLARARRLDEATESATLAEKSLKDAETALAEAEKAWRSAQTESMEASQALAGHKGISESSAAELARAIERLESVRSESQEVSGRQIDAQKSVDDLRPEMESLDKQIADLEEKKATNEKLRAEKVAEEETCVAENQKINEEYNELRLRETQLAERHSYGERMAQTRKARIETLERNVAEGRLQMRTKAKAAERGARLLDVIELLATSLARRADDLTAALAASESATNDVHANAAKAREAARAAHDGYDKASTRMSEIQVEKSRLEVQVESAVAAVVQECQTPLEIAEKLPQLEDRQTVEDERFRLERKIRNMGTINPDAAEEYEQLKERYDYLDRQLRDIEDARRSLNRIVRVINERMKDDFVTTFEQVNKNFDEIFSVLFPGGSASLSLVDPDDIDNSGVEVTAQPRGKRLSKMSLMSGGEKSLTALALLFAVYRTRTTPFYILDEVEAALDDTNLRRLISYIDTLRETTQLIMITHQRRTMEMADVLFGVSMQADGVTRVISQKLERALEYAQED